MTSPTLALAADLIARPSITPDDSGCQRLLAQRLERMGFILESMPGGPVSNLWARRGTAAPLLVFAGHTDVVPPGPMERWCSPPFEPTVRDGCLYGRGAADMKGSLAAMVTACERFLATSPDHRGSIALLLTSDEEGEAVEGTVRVIRTLRLRQEQIDYCVVGEPTCDQRFGDTLKNGRRGSLNGDLTVLGVQGHVAYPHLASNPLHTFAPLLTALCREEWDRGNAFFPPTSFQVSNIAMGSGADNLIPGELQVTINFRYSSELDQAQIDRRLRAILDAGELEYRLQWRLSGEPFLTPSGALVDAVRAATHDVTGVTPALSTSGGTSDGRFIAPSGAEVVEFGPRNGTIHQVNEHVAVAELDQLSEIYCGTLQRLLG